MRITPDNLHYTSPRSINMYFERRVSRVHWTSSPIAIISSGFALILIFGRLEQNITPTLAVTREVLPRELILAVCITYTHTCIPICAVSKNSQLG